MPQSGLQGVPIRMPPIKAPVPVREPALTRDLLENEIKRYRWKVGDYSYGRPAVKAWRGSGTFTLGRYCSISSGVTILLGGDHRVDWVSTYPFNVFHAEAQHIRGHPTTRGDVVIGNDVWIGTNVTIISGVTIGNGACLAAESVIVKDVPPYTIAGGNPAKPLKQRFSDEQIAALERIRWWDWEHERVLQHVELLMSDDIDAFIAACEGAAGP